MSMKLSLSIFLCLIISALGFPLIPSSSKKLSCSLTNWPGERYPCWLRSSEEEVQEVDTSLESLTLDAMLRPSTSCDADQMGGTDLAYIGDVVFELFCRSRHVWPAKRTSDLQNQVVAIVRAEFQAALLMKLKETFPLTSKEQQVLMRGRNAGGKSKNRVRNASAYQDATAFEALLGYLYISDQRRCQEMLRWLHQFIDCIELAKQTSD